MTDPNPESDGATALAVDSEADAAGGTSQMIDPLADHRASGRCAPKAWGFLLDEVRAARLRQMVAESTKPLPAWVMRECHRLLVPTGSAQHKAA